MQDFYSVFWDPTLNCQFDREGFVVVDMFSPADIARLQNIFERCGNHHPCGFSATILSKDLDYRRAVHAEVSHVLETKVNLTVRNYRLVCAGFAVKRAPAQAMPVHRDISMIRPAGRPEISFWAPLVDVGPENSCLDLLPGSHRLSHGPRWAGMNCSCAEEISSCMVSIPMRTGQALFMDGRILHASSAYPHGETRPVAVAPLTPREAALVYYHRSPGSQEMEEFEVDDGFYLRHHIGTRPEGHITAGLQTQSSGNSR